MVYKSLAKKAVVPFLLFLAGLGGGWMVRGYIPTSAVEALEPLREHHEDFQFINPLLACRTEKKEFPEFRPLEKELTEIINDKKIVRDAEKVSVYFRDLATGRWVGINEDEGYSPASLLKVPVMIAYFKLAEDNPAILTKQLATKWSADGNEKEFTKPGFPIRSGVLYTVEELMNAMIVGSDNNASSALFAYLNTEVFREIGRDLGITIPESDQVPGSMSAREYSLFFRILYNSSYLKRDYSERALELLSRTEFTKGLRVGIPAGVPVASKFGERGFRYAGSITAYQFHDCGIIYYPESPYLLCVMTHGGNLEKLQGTVADISGAVYSAVKDDILKK